MAVALPMKLRDWIPESKINWDYLSKNPNAIYLLEKNPDKINWGWLVRNPNAIHLIEKQIDYCNKNIFIKIYCYLFDNFDWKCYKKISKYHLSMHPNAIRILEKYPDMIDWGALSTNPNAIHILEKNPDKIDWKQLSLNPNAIHILEKNPDKIDWKQLSLNPNAIHILEQNPDKINWFNLSLNPNAIPILERNLDKIKWIYIVANPNAMDLIEKNIDLIQNDIGFSIIDNLCSNKNPYIINIIKKLQHQIDIRIDNIALSRLCRNPNAIDILKTKTNIIFNDIMTWWFLFENPAIFTYDYAAMRENHRALKEELIQRAWHPSRVAKWLDAGVDLEDL